MLSKCLIQITARVIFCEGHIWFKRFEGHFRNPENFKKISFLDLFLNIKKKLDKPEQTILTKKRYFLVFLVLFLRKSDHKSWFLFFRVLNTHYNSFGSNNADRSCFMDRKFVKSTFKVLFFYVKTKLGNYIFILLPINTPPMIVKSTFLNQIDN